MDASTVDGVALRKHRGRIGKLIARGFVCVAVATGAHVAAFGASSGADWGQLEGNPGLARYVSTSMKGTLRVAWRRRLPASASSVVANGGTLLVETDDGLTAVGSEKGEVRWALGSRKGELTTTGSALAFAGGGVAALGDAVVGLNLQSGAELFRREVGEASVHTMAADRGHRAWVSLSWPDLGRPAELWQIDLASGAVLRSAAIDPGYWTVSREEDRKRFRFVAARLGQMGEPPTLMFLQSSDTMVTVDPETLRIRGLRYASSTTTGPLAAGAHSLYCVAQEREATGESAPTELWALDEQLRLKRRVPLRRLSRARGRLTPLAVAPSGVILWDGETMISIDHAGKHRWARRLGSGGAAVNPTLGPVCAGEVVLATDARKGRRSNDRIISVSGATGRRLAAVEPGGPVVQLIAHRGAAYALIERPGGRELVRLSASEP